MKYLWLEDEVHYDGSQLRSQYIYQQMKFIGDAIMAWKGSCEVSFEHMVDGEDRLARSRIAGKNMLHFVTEAFQRDINWAVCFQRLQTALMLEMLKTSMAGDLAQKLFRDGDDIFFEERKLSVSVATISPLSALIHFAVNITSEGTPVPTISLEDLQIDYKSLANRFMQSVGHEFQTAKEASIKVRWVP